MRLRSWRAAGEGAAPGPARRWRPVLALIAGALLLGACGNPDAPLEYLTPAGPNAEIVDGLWNYVFIVATVVFVLVEGALLAVLFKFRAKAGDTSMPKQVEGNTRLEVLWTLIPALILAAIAVPTVQKIFVLTTVPPNAMEITVIGKQYWWEFEYPEEAKGVVTAGEMYIPVGRPIHVVMEAFGQAHEDELGVIHSFWVPKLAGKQDVVPGHRRTLELIADEPGEYAGQCAEFCGLSHANMRFKVVALPQEEFDQWVETHNTPISKPDDELAARGYELFEEATCIACHAIEGYEGSEGQTAEVRIGPNLTHFNERELFAGYTFENNDENLKAWLDDPQKVKPGAQMPEIDLAPDDIDALVAFLRTLGTRSEAE